MSTLPTGWVNTRFEAIADIQLGKMLDKAKNVGLPTAYLRNINIRWGKVETSDVLTMPMSNEDRSRYTINDGDVLVCEGGEPGRAAVWSAGPTELKFQKAIMRVRAAGGVSPDWLAQYLRLAAQDGTLSERFTGTTIKHLPREVLQTTHLPLPPMAEQRRIISKIDSLSARSKRAGDQLDHIPCLLEKYRQAVLVAAFNGFFSLENPQDQSGHKLVDHVRKQHEVLNRSRGGKCPSCLDPDQYLFEIPANWAWAAVEEIVEPGAEIVYGIVQPGPKLDTGVPYVRGTDIENGRIKVEQLLYTSPEIAKKYARASLKGGDVLLGIIRATKVAVVPPSLDGANITQGTARLRPSSALSTPFLAYWLECKIAQNWLHSKYRGIDMPGLNLRDVRRLPIPIPPRSTQIFIVERIEIAFECINRLAAEATSARFLIDRLDQAILAKAFRGELVPQDPADEPASVLLERIRAERAGAPAAKRRGRLRAPALP